MSNCACPGCHTAAKSSCSVCVREQYCSSSCQRKDWKTHKSICPILKKLSNKLQPYYAVHRIIDEILKSKKSYNIRVLEHLLPYAEYQFGLEVKGRSYRQRGDGERVSNWTVAVKILNSIYWGFLNSYTQNNTLSNISHNEASLPFLERSLSLLNPWVIHLDSHVNNRSNTLSEDQINFTLRQLSATEQSMAAVTINRNQFDVAEGHCQRCLVYSRRILPEGEEKTTLIFRALSAYCALRKNQDDLSDALNFAEECYNLVVIAYDPVHPQVQTAAGILIEILIKKGDLFDAERYAEITYSNLRDKKNGMDQESEEVATGSYNLADVIHRLNGELVRAEELAREALRIMTLIYGSGHQRLGRICDLFASILKAQNKLGDETRELFERSLAIKIKNEGPDGSNIADGNIRIGDFYYKLSKSHSAVDSKRTQLLLSKSHLEEGIRIQSKFYSPSHPKTVVAVSRLADVSRELSFISFDS